MAPRLRGPPVRELWRRMESESGSWWSRRGWTVILLLTAFALTFLIRSLFAVGIFQQWGWLYVFGGGSDSFYHWRVTEFILFNHTNLILDPLLRYPTGAINPREPLFDWMNAILGIVFAPLFHGNAVTAAAFFLDFDPPFWSALTVVPIYLIGREVSSRRMGLVAALTWPFIVGSIQAGGLGYANYLTFYTFFILLYLFSYLRTIRLVSSRTWVPNFRRPREAVRGLRTLLREERAAVKWAVFTGVTLGALALAWQGYPLAVAVVVIFLVTMMIIERIRRVDSFGLYVMTWIAGLVGFPMAMPYFLGQGLFQTWFDLPLLLYFGALGILLPFVLLREYPWVVTVPMLGALGAAALGGLYLVNPGSFQNLITGQGYFAKTLIYTTVAEAQAPSIDALILSYGIITFFLAFVGLALFIIHLARQKFRREHTLFVVFAIVSIYLPVSAAKFFYVGAAAFVLLPAEVLLIILDVAGYSQLRRTAASLAGTRGQLSSLRRAFKARHVLVFLLVFVLVVPNVWYAVDAGIPFNSKSQYSQQIYNTLPPFLRTASANASNYYLGAAGGSLDTPNQYDEAGYNWLAQQDSNLAYPNRPAFVSWWDYGFQAVAQGFHPTVADNFQNGIPAGGNFLLSQNESQAIAVLTITLLQAEQRASGNPYLPAALNTRLAADGVNLAQLHSLLANTSADVPLVIAHPERYLPVNPANLDPVNAMFIATAYFLATSLSADRVVQVYNDVQAYTGWSIQYAMVDSRLFPFSGQQTGIFYAPADLTDRIIGPGGQPITYYTLTALGSDGNTYSVGQVPPGVQIVNVNINWLPPFYNSMIYHVFMGYNGTQVGQGPGIPGLTGSVASHAPMPGWMLRHFQVVYRTAYYCPYSNPAAHPGCFAAVNLPEAKILAAQTNGTADTSSSGYFNGGEAILQYYPGEPMAGAVTLPDGTPVPGARLTVFDNWGIPHMTTVTRADGSYSVLLPPGNATVNVTAGPLNGLNQSGSALLASLRIFVPPSVGLSLHAPILIQPIVVKPAVVQGFLYWKTSTSPTYDPVHDPLIPGATVTFGGRTVRNYTASTDFAGGFRFPGVAPGVYNFTVNYAGARFSEGSVTVPPGQTVNETTGLAPATVAGVVRDAGGLAAAGALVTVSTVHGLVASVSTDPSGNYAVVNLVPGNYSLRAQGTGAFAANPTAVQLSAAGQHVTQNLTLVPFVTLRFPLLYNGNPLPSFPVRFTPILGSPATVGPNGTRPVPSASLVFTSNADGLVTAQLPVGNYSIYASGPVGTTTVAGFDSAYLPTDGGSVSIASLDLAPAIALTGSSPLPSGVNTASVGPTLVRAFTALGDETDTFANSSGHWSFALPAGAYSLEAVAFGVSSSTGNFSAIAVQELTGPATVTLPLSSARMFSTTAGSLNGSGSQLFPAQAGLVQVTVNPAGAILSAVASHSGSVSFLLPQSSPGTTYCLHAEAAGFQSYSACALSLAALESRTRLILPLINVTVNVTIPGLPSGVSVHLNATATSAPAVTTTTSGGAAFPLSLTPGGYRLSAWAPATSGSGIFLPTSSLNISVPLGSGPITLTIQIYHQVMAKGTLGLLPPAVTPSSVSLRIFAPPFNFTVNGTAFENGFFAAPGGYSVYAVAAASSTSYSSLTHVTISSSGTLTPAVLLATGVAVTGRLLTPTGGTLNATVPVVWTGAGNTSVVLLAVNGAFSIVFPSGTSFLPALNVTLPVTVDGALRYATYTARPGTLCAVGSSPTTCNVPLSVSYQLTFLRATFFYGGVPVTIAGMVRLIGPSPSAGVTTLATTNGTVSTSLLPGLYTVYATAGSGPGIIANVSTVLVPFPSSKLAIGLGATWTAAITLAPPPGTGPTVANLTWSELGGPTLVVQNIPFGPPQSFVLPRGVWTVTANATVSPYGVATPATATAQVNLLNGNQAARLKLLSQLVPAVQLAAVSPASIVVPSGGGTAAFAFTATNTGNVPVTVEFRGTPSSWNFTFTPSRVTLGVGPGNSSVGALVILRVPGGAATNHPPVNLVAVLASNSSMVVGSASPAPVVSLVPVPGLAFEASSLPQYSAPRSASLPFILANTGNTPETVTLTIVDQSRLQQLGWSSSFTQGRNALLGPVSLDPGGRSTVELQLTASAFAVPPGSVSLSASAITLGGSTEASYVLTVPVAGVNVSGPIIITGPGVGSPPAVPEELVTLLFFLPAIALLITVFSYRWWKRRRWTRR